MADDKSSPQSLPVNTLNEQIILGNMIKSSTVLEQVMVDPQIKETTFLAFDHQVIYLILKDTENSTNHLNRMLHLYRN